jgi:hypothetical protein
MKTSSIIYMGLTKFKTKHKAHRKVPSQLWRHLRRQSCDGTRLSLLFIEIFILVLVVHTEHSTCSTLGLQRHGGTWWPIVSRILMWSDTCGSCRFAPWGHLWLTVTWYFLDRQFILCWIRTFLLWGDRHTQIVAKLSILSWARQTPNLCLPRVHPSVPIMATLWQLYSR